MASVCEILFESLGLLLGLGIREDSWVVKDVSSVAGDVKDVVGFAI